MIEHLDGHGEYVILHRRSPRDGNRICWCYADYISDRATSELEWCRLCDEPVGLGVPILFDEGRLTVHLSCAIEQQTRVWPWHPDAIRVGGRRGGSRWR
jgi:hypothetical protein